MAKQDVRVELFHSGVWNSSTDRVFVEDQITITRGQGGEGQQLKPATAALTLDNTGGRFSPRNPRSPLFGLIGRNTPIRISTGDPHPAATNFDDVDTTAHAAPSVDVPPLTISVLLCCWAAPQNNTWTVPASMAPLVGQHSTQSIQAAVETIVGGEGGPTGTRTATFGVAEDYMSASVLLPGDSLSIEESEGDSDKSLTLNSGTQPGDWVVLFSSWWNLDFPVDESTFADIPDYPTSDRQDGWILLGDTGTIDIGDAEAQAMRLKVWAMQVKVSGTQNITLGGTDTARSTLHVVRGVRDWSPRFVGEVSSWPPQWNIPGTVVRTPIQAAGITRRLGRAQTTLKSAPERYLARTGPAGFWPLDDPPGSNESRAVVGEPMRPGKAPAPLVRKQFPAYGEGQVAAWLPPGIKGSTETGTIAAPIADGTTGGWVVELMYRADQSTTGSFPIGTSLIVNTDGFEFRVAWGADDGIIGTIILDSSGGIVGSSDDPDNSPLLDGQPHHIRWTVREVGTFASSTFFVDGVEAHAGSIDIGVQPLPAHGGLKLAWNGEAAAQAAVSFSMLVFYQFIPPIADALDAAFGHEGERPAARFDRILREEGIPRAVVGNPDDEEVPLGPQFPGKLVELLREIGAAGMGWLYEAREFRGYIYRTVGSGYNQSPALELDYAANEVAPPLRPTDDDKDTVNDVTAQRRKGGEVRRVRELGPLNVNDPADDPQGVGRYDTSTTLNVAATRTLANQAQWLLHLGTTDEARYPKITVDLDATPQLAAAAAAVDIGDRITIVNPPDDPDVGLPPETITQLVVGYTEPVGSHRRKITFNCVPESPYHIAEVEHPLYSIIGSDRTTLAADFTSGTDTTMQVSTSTLGPGVTNEWTDADAPFDIIVAGVRLTVTAVTGTGSSQTFTVDQTPVNGITKTIDASEGPFLVELFHKSYIGL